MPVHPSTAQARVIVDELVRCGMRHLVACPGSRNAPLSLAAHEAADAGRLTLHVRIDERSAGFLALGLARSGQGPVAVFCTSGTAVANLHPAVLEAHHSRTPLLVLTADRPAELHGSGANQTVEQRGIFAQAAECVDFPLAERRAATNAVWRGTVCRAVALATSGPGPVQVNLPFREPLVPGDSDDWPEPLTGRADGGPWTRWPATATAGPGATDLAARTVLLVGDPVGRQDRVIAAAEVAAVVGWPVIAEPTGLADALTGGADVVLPSGSLLLNSGDLPTALRPDEVLVAGRLTLTRGVGALLRAARRVRVLGDQADWTDPQRLAAEVVDHLDRLDAGILPASDTDWLADWQAADGAAGDAADKVLAGQSWPTGPLLARELVATLPERAVLFLGSSNPIRFVDLVGRPGADLRIRASRGVAGIDGSVSTAAGLALGLAGEAGPCYALLGDLTFLHDTNGLLIGPGEPRPDLAIVVLNDDGGGIFTLLEQGAPEHASGFERMFGTPHGVDIAALCAAHHVPHVAVSDADGLHAALRPGPGLRVIEVGVDRADLREEQNALVAAVADAVRLVSGQRR
jgi:2-succinyl-5-enolpyruvyl-6-hydroxy-3-cyclohexene-1-carboxylate synthase